jgi:hypothetical protein
MGRHVSKFAAVLRGTLAVAALAFMAAVAAPARADTLYVGARGDHGWQSRDTRSATGTNLVSPADDAAIDSVIKFGPAPSGGSYANALNLITPASNSAKASLGVASPLSGFAAGDALLDFTATYEWFTEGPPTFTSRISPLKIGVQTSAYAGLPPGSTRTGENDWNMLLVQLPSSNAGVWNTESIDFDTGLWYVVQRSGLAGNTFSTPVSPLAGQTLQDIYNGGAGFGGNADLAAMFASNSKLSVVEFGLGTSQQNANNYVSYLETSIYNGGDRVVFGAAPVPLPVAAWMGITLVGGLGGARGLKRLRSR